MNGNFSTTDFDINGNGLTDYKDLEDFDNNVDLDGDGIVSSFEKNLLLTYKKLLEENISRNMIKEAFNNISNIDNIISATELDILSEEKIKYHAQYYSEQMHGDITYSHTRRYYAKLTSDMIGYAMSTSDGCNDIHLKFISYMADGSRFISTEQCTKDILSALKKDITCFKPQNAYLSSIQSADLSKEELQNILNKIISSSEKAQSELCEVVKAIEAKLASM